METRGIIGAIGIIPGWKNRGCIGYSMLGLYRDDGE